MSWTTHVLTSNTIGWSCSSLNPHPCQTCSGAVDMILTGSLQIKGFQSKFLYSSLLTMFLSLATSPDNFIAKCRPRQRTGSSRVSGGSRLNRRSHCWCEIWCWLWLLAISPWYSHFSRDADLLWHYTCITARGKGKRAVFGIWGCGRAHGLHRQRRCPIECLAGRDFNSMSC